MALLESKLLVKKSTIPGAGKGLFTTVDIKKGTRIIKYEGIKRTWKEIRENPVFNGYVYYLNKDHVIDAKPVKEALARYANDAKGIGDSGGKTNNCMYENVGTRVYIVAKKAIEAGSELLVGYGKEYWDSVKHNIQVEAKEAKKAEAKKVKKADTRKKNTAKKSVKNVRKAA